MYSATTPALTTMIHSENKNLFQIFTRSYNNTALGAAVATTTMMSYLDTSRSGELIEEEFRKKMNLSEDVFDLIAADRETTICSDSFYDLGTNYKKVHGYIALLVCIFGTFANILNLIVLTRKEMSTPINKMLTALAFADMLVMLEYIPFAFYMYILTHSNTYAWAVFVLFHSHFTQILHTISIQLTLTMAIWRYLALKSTNRNGSLCTLRRCYWAITASFICPIFICIPNYLTFSIYHHQKHYFLESHGQFFSFFQGKDTEKETLQTICHSFFPGIEECLNAIYGVDVYRVDFSDLARANNGLLHGIHFWTYSVLVKLIPCVVLTFFMGWLLNTLYNAKRRHKQLTKNSGIPLVPRASTCQTEANLKKNQNTIGGAEEKGNEQTTTMGARVVIDEVSTRSIHSDPNGTATVNMNGNSLVAGGRENSSSRRESNISGSIGYESMQGNQSVGPEVRKGSEEKGRAGKSGSRGFIRLPSLRKGSHSTPTGNKGHHKSGKRSDRTSKMLIAVLCLFLLTEFPQGIMSFLSGLYGQEFFRQCYNSFAEVWDIIALINSAINFILYCFMSKQFRQQFRLIFHLNRCFKSRSWISINNCYNHHPTSTSIV